jgi:hypothetical protein
MDDDLADGLLTANVARRLLRLLQAADEVADGTDAPSATAARTPGASYADARTPALCRPMGAWIVSAARSNGSAPIRSGIVTLSLARRTAARVRTWNCW